MNSFVEMWNEFVKQFITLKGYENVLKGLWATMQIAVIGLLIGIVIGTLIAVVRVMPKYKLIPRILDKICVCYIELFRGTPMVVQLLIGYWVLLPLMGITVNSGIPVAVIVFGLNSGAYVSEIMRGGINSVDAGQMEAGYCVGMSYLQIIRRIVLPQALRTAFPPLSNSLISMVKDTSLAANITLTEMFMVTQRIVARTYEPLALYIEVALIYLIFSTVLTYLQRIGEKKLNSYGHKGE